MTKLGNILIPGNELLFLALGGSGEIGMNVNCYGCRGQWLMIDCGVTFADPDYPGIDVILPDLGFIEGQLDGLQGIVITHGHADHIGALPYLALDLGVRSEEHTSELQSLMRISYAVFCVKKKKKQTHNKEQTQQNT